MDFNSYKPLRLIELFAGIGSQAKALKNLGVEFEHWYVCEFDKYAIQSYNAVHGTNFETSDITKLTAKDLNIVDTEHYNYLLTYSFPCQDLSNAGKGRGMEKGSGTRSGLLWEVERLLNECTELPQILLMENVPQVHGKKNINDFNKWIEFLESKGYSNYWSDLNAKDYGIPQSRNRCFMVSILGDCDYEFPKPIKLELTLKDVLETEVDEKFYLSDTKDYFIKHSFESEAKGNGFRFQPHVEKNATVAKTITTRAGSRMDDNYIIDIDSEQSSFKFDSTNAELKLITSNKKSELKAKLCNELLENGLVEEGDVIRHSYTNSRLAEERKDITQKNISPTLDTRCDCLGVVVKGSNNRAQYIVYDDYNGRIKADQNHINTLTTNCGSSARRTGVKLLESSVGFNSELRIRKLTPKECWRLMGFTDEDVERAGKICSNSKLYKQAGNSIVVDVLMAIFKELFIPKKTRSEWLDELLGGV